MYPPSLIALACLNISCLIQKKDAKQWFSELNVDMEKIFEITRHILYLYEMWKTYDEKEQMKELLEKIPKPRLTPSTSSSSMPQQQSH
jgi:cyclin C